MCVSIVDETAVKIGSEYFWLWVAIDLKTKRILAANISRGRNTLVAERFLHGLVETLGSILFPQMAGPGILKPVGF